MTRMERVALRKVMFRDPTRTNTWQYGRIIKVWHGRLNTMYLVAPERSEDFEYDNHVVFLYSESEEGKNFSLKTESYSSMIGTQNDLVKC